MSAWTGWAIAASAAGIRAVADAPPTPGGNRFEVRTLIGVLAIIIGLLIIMIVLVAMSSIRRRLRATTADREARRRAKDRSSGRRVDAWAEAGKRAVLAPPPPPDEAQDRDADEGPEDRV